MAAVAVMRFSERLAQADEDTPLLDAHIDKMEVPQPTVLLAKTNSSGRRVPQAIAHRGYKAAHPENTMGAFKGAVGVGAHAIETDIHLTKDGVVVLSHDATLKRCYGHEDKIIDCDWTYLSTLRTLKDPHEPMPRLLDLLEYLATPDNENIWVLLDIKLDNDADDVMRLIAETIKKVKPSRPWNQRIVLGCWAAKYIPLCDTYLPGFPITHIGFSTVYARQFLRIPNISFNMLQKIMIGPCGAKFLADCKAQKRAVMLWTVNEVKWMKWSVRKEVDGVITDDPKLYLDVVGQLEREAQERGSSGDEKGIAANGGWGKHDKLSMRDMASTLWIHTLVLIFGALFRWRYGRAAATPIKNRLVERRSKSTITMAA